MISYNAPSSIPDPRRSHDFASQFYESILAGFGWQAGFFDKLDERFTSVGLSVVVSDKKEEKRGNIAGAFFEYFVTLCAQMVVLFHKIDPKGGVELERLLGKIVDAGKVDGVMCSPIPKIVVGKKPL